MENNLELTIIANLLYSKDYATKVIPYLKKSYFSKHNDTIVEEITKFFANYSTVPSKKELIIEINTRKGIDPEDAEAMMKVVEMLDEHPFSEESSERWIYDKTEKFCQERALINAITDCAEIVAEKNETKREKNKGRIFDIVKDALAVSFDESIGLDYFRDIERRWAMYHTSEDKISWGIKELDDISNGGISKKNLVCVVAPTGSGKSLFMCSIASNAIKNGNNVLYITLEMSEDRVAERIDSNLYGESIDSIRNMDEVKYKTKAEELAKRDMGRLIIREYPTGGANANHFRKLLTELKNQQNFVPDLIVVDYLNICSSSRYLPAQVNSYGIIKAISEELRGLAVEYNTAVLTATQTNRSGINNSDLEMTEVSESIATAFILDMFIALIRTDTLDEQGQILIKQLKNRYSDLTKNRTFCLGIDRDRMTIYSLDSAYNYNNPTRFSSPLPSGVSVKQKGKLDLSKINV
jgi:replicative DNA helicase